MRYFFFMDIFAQVRWGLKHPRATVLPPRGAWPRGRRTASPHRRRSGTAPRLHRPASCWLLPGPTPTASSRCAACRVCECRQQCSRIVAVSHPWWEHRGRPNVGVGGSIHARASRAAAGAAKSPTPAPHPPLSPHLSWLQVAPVGGLIGRSRKCGISLLHDCEVSHNHALLEVRTTCRMRKTMLTRRLGLYHAVARELRGGKAGRPYRI